MTISFDLTDSSGASGDLDGLDPSLQLEMLTHAMCAELELQAQQQAVTPVELQALRECLGTSSAPDSRVLELTRQLQEIQQENSSLQQLLYQQQEALERQDVAAQQHQQLIERDQARWTRLQARLPPYFDCAAIDIAAVELGGEVPVLHWRLRDVSLGGRFWPQLVLRTVMVEGQPGLAFDEQEPLIPLQVLVPANVAQQQRYAGLTSDAWARHLAAASAIEQYFASDEAGSSELDGFDRVFWRQLLQPLVTQLKGLPEVFRFDRVGLKSELVHADYEHLWLRLENASHGSRLWPRFELRLGAADVVADGFSTHPKLELPLIDGQTRPFDSWFEESSDDFGGKFELRFDIAHHRFDLKVWARVQAGDQKLLLALLQSLPRALLALQQDAVAIGRDWADWTGLAQGMLLTLRKLSAAQSGSSSRQPRVSAASQRDKR